MTEPHVVLHPRHGVNPKLTCCVNCGKDIGVALLGINDWLWQCQCGANNLGRQRLPPRTCGSCDKHGKAQCNWIDKGPMGDVKIPDGLCDACQANQDACAAEVAQGGVWWRCPTCGSEGALKAGAELAVAVRKQMGIEAPEPCGVEFTPDECPICSEGK